MKTRVRPGAKDRCLEVPYSPAGRDGPREPPCHLGPAGNVAGKSVPVEALCLSLAFWPFPYKKHLQMCNNNHVHLEVALRL